MMSQELQYHRRAAVEAAVGDVAHHQCGRAHPAVVGAGAQDLFDQSLVVLDLHLEGEGRADVSPASGLSQSETRIGALVAVGAGPAARPEQVVVDRVVGHADRGPAVDQVGQRHRPIGHAAQEVRGAVDRVDDPQARGADFCSSSSSAEQVVRGLGAGEAIAAALLAEHRIVGEGDAEAGADQLLDLAVGDAHEVLHALVLDVELVALDEVVVGEAPGLAGDGAGDEETVLEVAVVHGWLSWALLVERRAGSASLPGAPVGPAPGPGHRANNRR